MMSKFILKRLCILSVVSLLTLLLIIIIVQFSQFLYLLETADAKITDIGRLIVFIAPKFALILIPFTVAIATFIIFSNLKETNQITILKVSHVSNIAILKPVILFAGLSTIFCYALSLFIVPISWQKLKDFQDKLETRQAVSRIKLNQFINFGNITIFLFKDGSVFFAQSDKDFEHFLLSERGTFEYQDGKILLDINDALILSRIRSSQKTMYATLDKYKIFTTTPQFHNSSFQNYIHTGTQSNTSLIRKYKEDLFRVELHQRLYWPLFAFAIPMAIGVIIVISRRSRTKMGEVKFLPPATLYLAISGLMFPNIFTSSIVGVIFMYLNIFLIIIYII